jgi:hypothetical protein
MKELVPEVRRREGMQVLGTPSKKRAKEKF